jgi:phage/plasmid-associated DNA primase
MEDSVLEVCGDRLVPRAGKPDDYLTYSTHVYYRDVPETDPGYIQVNEWFHQMFIAPGLFEYAWKIISAFALGGNIDKAFYCFNGEHGNNSKSMFVKLLELMLGDYFVKVPITFFTTSKKDSSSASPEEAQMTNCRVVEAEEPEPDAELKGIKGKSGGDTYYTRGLYDSGSKKQVTYKMVLMSNKPPLVAHPDKATKERITMLPFDSIWTYDAPKSREEQFAQGVFQRVRDFEAQIPSMVVPAWNVVIKLFFTRYRREGLVKPEIVTKRLEEYWYSNDPYSNFVRSRLVICKNPDNSINPTFHLTLKDIHTDLKKYYGDFYSGLKVPTYATSVYQLHQVFEELGCIEKAGMIYGVKFNIDDTLKLAGPPTN